MTQQELRNFRYRYDLDGLRGIAIALVVFYHVFVGRVSGGVDVFLLLSGYFFLGSQLRYAAKPNASLNPWWPIWRTIRRLVPALVLVIGTTVALVFWVTPQLMRTELVKQVTATLLYYQNWELARQNADYAAASADTSPLQHMWSMAVQGQFYLAGILFALALAAFLKARPSRLSVNDIAGPVLIVVTIASFIYASRHGLYGTPENYYSTFSRAWELTLGAVLAIYGARVAVPQRMADIMSGIGLLALVFTGALIADSTAYPGPLSLLPLGGAVLIILGGGGKLSRMMASKPSRWLGDIAYPLYLWHWPLLILSTSYLGLQTPPRWLGVAIIAVSLVLADLTHRLVERPLRQHRKRPLADDMPVNRALASLRQRAGALRALGGVAVAACTSVLFAVPPLWNNSVENADDQVLDPALYPGVMALKDVPVPTGVPIKPDPILVGGIAPPISEVHCFIPDETPADFFIPNDKYGNPCIFGDPDADYEVYLVGGSHAEQWSSALDKLGKEMGFKLVPLLRQACPIEYGDTSGVTEDCAQWGELVIDRIIDEDPDLVISNTTRPQDKYGHGPDVVPAGYAGFWEQLAQNDIPFLGLRDNPWGFDDQGMPVEFDECYVATEDAIGCGMPRQAVYQPVDPSAAILAQYSNMIAVDTSTWFCDPINCPVILGNIMVYRDMHHISNAFADSAMPLLRREIQPFMDGKVRQQQPPPPPPPPAPAPAPAPGPAPGPTGSPAPAPAPAPAPGPNGAPVPAPVPAPGAPVPGMPVPGAPAPAPGSNGAPAPAPAPGAGPPAFPAPYVENLSEVEPV